LATGTPQPPSTQEPAAAETDEASPSDHRSKGKVAHLPKKLREEVNEMIDEGLTYAEIIYRLGPAGAAITERNVVNGVASGLGQRATTPRIEARPPRIPPLASYTRTTTLKPIERHRKSRLKPLRPLG